MNYIKYSRIQLKHSELICDPSLYVEFFQIPCKDNAKILRLIRQLLLRNVITHTDRHFFKLFFSRSLTPKTCQFVGNYNSKFSGFQYFVLVKLEGSNNYTTIEKKFRLKDELETHCGHKCSNLRMKIFISK